MEPAERTAAVEEPVIMPGNMMMSMIKTSQNGKWTMEFLNNQAA